MTTNEARSSAGPVDRTAQSTAQEAERKRYEDALRVTRGNVSEAARRLGVSRMTFYRRMRQLQITTRRGEA